MLGHRHVFETVGSRGGDHVLQAAAPIARPGRVHVQIAPQVLDRHQVRQCSVGRGLDLPGVLAQLGWDVFEVESPVDVFLGLGGDHRFVLHQSVLVQQPPPGDGALSQSDVVRFRAGEVERRRAKLVCSYHPQVDLDGLFGRRDRVVDEWRGFVGNDEEIDVGNRVPEPPQAPAVTHCCYPVDLANAAHQAFSDPKRLGDRDAAVLAGEPELFDGLPDLLFGLGAHTG